MTKKELSIIKKFYNESWQNLLNREIHLLEDGGQLEDNYRMSLLYAYVAIAGLASNLGLSVTDLTNTETEVLIEKVDSLMYSNKEE